MLLTGQVSVSTFISDCHSPNDVRTVRGKRCVCLCVSLWDRVFWRGQGPGDFKTPLNNTVSPNKLLGGSD